MRSLAAGVGDSPMTESRPEPTSGMMMPHDHAQVVGLAEPLGDEAVDWTPAARSADRRVDGYVTVRNVLVT